MINEKALTRTKVLASIVLSPVLATWALKAFAIRRSRNRLCITEPFSQGSCESWMNRGFYGIVRKI